MCKQRKTVERISSTTTNGYGYQNGYGYNYGYDYGYQNGYGYNYGYGYGYGYGYNYGYGYSNTVLRYRITLNTNYFSVGAHRIKLGLTSGNGEVYSNEQTIRVNASGTNDNGTGNNDGSSSSTTNPGSSSGGSGGGSSGHQATNNVMVPLSNNKKTNTTPVSPEINKTENKNNGTNFLTGAITGIGNFAKSPIGIGTIITLFASAFGGVFFFGFKKRKKKEERRLNYGFL